MEDFDAWSQHFINKFKMLCNSELLSSIRSTDLKQYCKMRFYHENIELRKTSFQ